MTQRREFLKFMAASPLLTSYEAFAQEVEETLGERLTDPSEVINVFEMESIAREKIHQHISVICRPEWTET